MNFEQEKLLKLNAAGLRFNEAAIEREYREWRLDSALPIIQLGLTIALGLWIFAQPGVYYWDPEQFRRVFAFVGYVVIPIFALGTALTFLRSWRKWAFATVIFLQILSGSTLIWATYVIGGSAGGAVVWGVFAALFMPFMRMPPLAAMLAVTPYSMLLLWLMAGAYKAGELTRLDTYNYTSAPIMACLLVIIACAFIDRFARQTFIKDKLIESQHGALERSARLIQRYVPSSVAQQIMIGQEASVDEPQRRRVTVLFSDIVGFTDMADRLDAESVTQILNEYMAAMADVVEQRGGTLNEFSGDGLMAVFGAPNELTPEDQVLNAVQAAQVMQARLPNLNEGWLKLGIGEPMQIRIGINTGVLSVGSFGSEGRMTYTAIGLQTNIAARIQSYCEPDDILLSDASWHLVKDKIDCTPKGEVECKGVHFPVKVYAPASKA